MIGPPAGTHIWIVAGVTDLRRGFMGLSGMVQTALQQSPFSGHVFIFQAVCSSSKYTCDPTCAHCKRLTRCGGARRRGGKTKGRLLCDYRTAKDSQGRRLEQMRDRLGGGSEVLPALFIGKWTVKIMYSLKKRPQRHGQLRRGLGSISLRMLTRTLRNLESAGLITREVTRTRSVAVEYSLTKLGRQPDAGLHARSSEPQVT
jgi:DNA-binding HxlR family transcriptional regulator